MDKGIFEKAKEGDEQSIELIVEQYYRLAYSTAHDWISKGIINMDDGISEANLALMKCVRGNFDPDKGGFASYLIKSVDNQIRMYLRKQKREAMYQYVDNVVVLEDGEVDLMHLLEDEDHIVEEIVEVRLMISYIEKIVVADGRVSNKEAQCMMMRLEGWTCDEIAKELGISQSYVSRLSNNALDKIRDVLEENGGYIDVKRFDSE